MKPTNLMPDQPETGPAVLVEQLTGNLSETGLANAALVSNALKYESPDPVEEVPIDGFKQELADVISKHDYIIIEAETGSGKSTRVPWWLYQWFGYSVLVTEPLIETILGTAEYVAQLMGVVLGTIVGYRSADEQLDSPETKILYATDGLAMVRSLLGRNRFDVLVIDEGHVWNINQETLEAHAWQQLRSGTSRFKKIVVLSASMDSQALSRKRNNAPIIKIPGRQFNIERRKPGPSIESDVRKQVRKGRDVLVFMPTQASIEQLIKDLQGLDAELIPFYSKLPRAEKNRAYVDTYKRSKVVISTNALETGRTLLPSLLKGSARRRQLEVIDSGLERRTEVINGIEGSYLRWISIAQALQRMGRTGRVGPGGYTDHCSLSDSEREAYPVAEILRTRLDHTILRLAEAGFDAGAIPFFHEISEAAIDAGKKSLVSLGAFDSNNQITYLGRKMVKLPADVHISKMIFHGASLGVLNDVLTIAACMAVGGIRVGSSKWKAYTSETMSDLLAERDIFEEMCRNPPVDFLEAGVSESAFFQAQELRYKLEDRLWHMRIKLGSSGDPTAIKKAICAGLIDHVYQAVGTDGIITKKLFVANLSARVTETELAELFAQAGAVVSVVIPIDGETGNNRSFAFVEMQTQADSEAAIKKCHWQKVDGQPIAVKPSRDEGLYRNPDDPTDRKLSKCVFAPREKKNSGDAQTQPTQTPYLTPKLVVGLPLDLEVANQNSEGTFVYKHLSMATIVDDPQWLFEVAPHLVSSIRHNYRFSREKQAVVCDLDRLFNGRLINTEVEQADRCEQTAIVLAAYLARQAMQSDAVQVLNAELIELEAKSAGKTPGKISEADLASIFAARLTDCCALADVAERNIDLSVCRTDFVSDSDAQRIRALNPDTVMVGNEKCEVSYAYRSGTNSNAEHTVLVKVSMATLTTLVQSQVRNLIPSGVSYRLQVAGFGYESIIGTRLGKLREEIEIRRLDRAWNIFRLKYADRVMSVKGLVALPALPGPVVYDTQKAVAFPAFMENDGSWYQIWFQSETEANQSQTKALAAKAMLDRAEQERREQAKLAAQQAKAQNRRNQKSSKPMIAAAASREDDEKAILLQGKLAELQSFFKKPR